MVNYNMRSNFNTYPRSNHEESDTYLMNSYITNNPSKVVPSYYLVARLKIEEYKYLYSSVSEFAKHCGGIPIEDIHCTLHSMKGNADPVALHNMVSRYCSTLSQFHLEFTQVVRTESSLGDRIWLLINKTDQLYKMHREVGDLARDLSLACYPTEDWKPHIKLLILPKGARSIPENDLFARILDMRVQITTLDLTQRIGETKWETIAQFELKP